jgi:hypothetical protein
MRILGMMASPCLMSSIDALSRSGLEPGKWGPQGRFFFFKSVFEFSKKETFFVTREVMFDDITCCSNVPSRLRSRHSKTCQNSKHGHKRMWPFLEFESIFYHCIFVSIFLTFPFLISE